MVEYDDDDDAGCCTSESTGCERVCDTARVHGVMKTTASVRMDVNNCERGETDEHTERESNLGERLEVGAASDSPGTSMSEQQSRHGQV